MATAKTELYPTDELGSLKDKKRSVEDKIAALQTQILEQRAKEREIEKKIFAREDGRLLKAVKRAMEERPEVKEVIDRYLEGLEIANYDDIELDPKPKRGRPAKAAINSTAEAMSGKFLESQKKRQTS